MCFSEKIGGENVGFSCPDGLEISYYLGYEGRFFEKFRCDYLFHWVGL